MVAKNEPSAAPVGSGAPKGALRVSNKLVAMGVATMIGLPVGSAGITYLATRPDVAEVPSTIVTENRKGDPLAVENTTKLDQLTKIAQTQNESIGKLAQKTDQLQQRVEPLLAPGGPVDKIPVIEQGLGEVKNAQDDLKKRVDAALATQKKMLGNLATVTGKVKKLEKKPGFLGRFLPTPKAKPKK